MDLIILLKTENQWNLNKFELFSLLLAEPLLSASFLYVKKFVYILSFSLPIIWQIKKPSTSIKVKLF